MVTKKLFLYFPQSETEKPIIYRLVKDYNLMVNIFRARVTPEEYGYLVLDVSGEEQDVEAGIEFLRTLNIEINENGKGLRWDSDQCVHCGNCLTHCPTAALHTVNRATMEISFDEEQCIHCLSCLKNCPFGAVSSVF